MTIRMLRISDIDEIIDLRVKQQKEDFSDNPELFGDIETMCMETNNFIYNNLYGTLVGYGKIIDAKIVSVCFLQTIPMMPQLNNKNGLHGYICNVYTLPEHRRNGYQTKLLDICIAEAKNIGIVKLDLTTNNPDAIALYTKKGFYKNDLAYRITL